MSKVLTIVCQKGGVGKTTLAVNLAADALRHGLAVAIADTDPQATCCFWAEARGKTDIAVQPIFATLLKSRIAALQMAGCDLTIIDTPPHAKDIATDAIRLADFVLIPTKAAAFDLKATGETISQCEAVGKPYAVVLTHCPPRESEELASTMAALAEQQRGLCPVLVHSYVDFPRSQSSGLGVAEFNPDGKAAADIKRLYTYTLKQLGMAAGPAARRA